MIKVKDIKVGTDEIVTYMVALKEKQKEIKDTEKLYYSDITLHAALKYKLFITNFLLHPLVLKTKDVFTNKECISEKDEVRELVREVLEYEIMEEKTYLTQSERDTIISIFKKMNKPARVLNGERV